jgi:demethylmenaquinone methyltransferase/2-methoxy-6-polyprenyl-1,4-benzoquinol methylase
MQAYYAARAPYYDAVYLKPERRQDIAFLTQHLPARLEGRNVLEVACGTGYWTQHIAPAVKSLHATDGTAEPLEFAKLRPNTAQTKFSQADAYKLSDELGKFDGALAALWFSHVPINARAQFFKSLHARLVPGARVVLFDNSEVQCLDFPIAERDADLNTYQLRMLNDGSTHRVLKNFPSEEELASLVSEFAASWSYLKLQNFWLLEYEIRSVQ